MAWIVGKGGLGRAEHAAVLREEGLKEEESLGLVRVAAKA
jgi:hypothetical protein